RLWLRPGKESRVPGERSETGTQGDTLCPSALCSAGFLGECLIALAAVEQMPPHGGARLRDSMFPDRAHDFAMFLLEYLAVDAPGQPGAAGYGLTRDDETPEMFQQASELWIAGGIRDTAMKRKILIDRILAALERAIDHMKAIDDIADLGRRGALGGQACSLDFDAGAQLHDLEHLAYR